MTTLDEQLPALLQNGSAELLKALKKLSSNTGSVAPTTTSAPSRRSKEVHSPYINNTTLHCALCGTESTTAIVMTYKEEYKGYTTGYSILPGREAPTYPIRKLNLITDSCASCPQVLASLPKEHLVSMLITRSRKNHLPINCLETIARKINSLD